MTSSLRLSPSGAFLWAQCPRRWWFRYVDRIPEPPPGEAAVVGTFVHRILELLLAEEPGRRTPEQAKLLARAAYAEIEEAEDFVALELDVPAALRFRHRAWQTVEAYFDLVRPEEVHPVAQELEVEVDIAGVPFRGFIDLVEEDRTAEPVAGGRPAVVVTDYKTGRPPEQGKPWSAERADEKLLQPQWYAAALAELGVHRPVRARLLYFSAVDRGDRFVRQTGELSVAVDDERQAPALAELRQRWDDINMALDKGEAPSAPGPLCGWCPYVDRCAEGEAECRRRWSERNEFTGERRLREDAPAVTLLQLA